MEQIANRVNHRMGWSDTQVVFRFVTIQVLLAALLCLLEG